MPQIHGRATVGPTFLKGEEKRSEGKGERREEKSSAHSMKERKKGASREIKQVKFETFFPFSKNKEWLEFMQDALARKFQELRHCLACTGKRKILLNKRT